MHPIVGILRMGGVERPIGSYGVLLSLAMLTGSALACRSASRARLDVGATIAALGFTLAGGLAGGWSLFVCVEWARTGSPVNAFERGGLVFYGAVLGGAAALALAARVLALPLGRLLDVAVPALPAAHALGRLGCLLGGCCYGKPWQGPWAIAYTHPMAPAAYPPVLRHPVPLYESAALLGLAFAFALWTPARVGEGHRALVYLACYGLLRVVTETFRGDDVRGLFLGGLASTSQAIGIAVAACSLGVLFAVRGRRAA